MAERKAMKELNTKFERSANHTPQPEDSYFVVHKNEAQSKIIIGIDGKSMLNVDNWWCYPQGIKVVEKLEKPKYNNWIKAVYIEFRQGTVWQMQPNWMELILQQIDEYWCERTIENIQTFAECIACMNFGMIRGRSNHRSNIPRIKGNKMCEICYSAADENVEF